MITNSPGDLLNKNALITGSTQGIGLEIAKFLAAEGCNVGLNGLGNPEVISRTVDRLRADSGHGVNFYDADLRQPDSIYSMIANFVEHFGKIDILVNNAGIQHVSAVENFPVTMWDAIIAINLSAVFHTTKAALPVMVQNQWGRIVNIASVHGLVGSQYKSAYVSAKHGVIGFTKVVAVEYAKHSITCNAICPGYVDTELIREQIQNDAQEKGIGYEKASQEFLRNKHANEKFVDARAIASLAAHLCHQESSSINGAAIPVDCGWTAL